MELTPQKQSCGREAEYREEEPTEQGGGEELVLSSWEVSHTPCAPRPPARVTDHLFAVLRGGQGNCTHPTRKPRPKGAGDCLSHPALLPPGPRASTTSRNSRHLCMPSTMSGLRVPSQRAGLDGADTVNKERKVAVYWQMGKPGLRAGGTREVVEGRGGRSLAQPLGHRVPRCRAGCSSFQSPRPERRAWQSRS